jgi:DNA-binding CsgD family transcriptional regulator
MGELDRGREACAGLRWSAANRSLSAADRQSPLAAEDLRLLATAAYMIGDESEYFAVLEREYQAHLDEGDHVLAGRVAIWLGIMRARSGEMGAASGWLGRGQRLVQNEPPDSIEHGYLMMPTAFKQLGEGDLDAAAATLARVAELGADHDHMDLFALATHERGHVLVMAGETQEGLRLLDEAMVPATTNELSPIATGIVYCGTIAGCQEAFELGRAQEWTQALSDWCDAQPEMVSFSGRCLVHRAEILLLRGDWQDALAEAVRAHERCLAGGNPRAAATALYRCGEIHRLRGEFAEADAAYVEAGHAGYEPQPGMALLRLAQGDNEPAAAAIRRVLSETTGRATRATLLPAAVEIMLAVGDQGAAVAAADELDGIASGEEERMLGAMAAAARGSLTLATGDPATALADLRRAAGVWQELGAPYEAARARTLLGQACRALGDEDAAAIELQAARDAFAKVAARPDLARVEALIGGGAPADTHDLTPREQEVLRLVAAGDTNRAIATALVLSERTVDRHVSNIFAKLDVSSRAAATAFAYQHRLL